MSDKKTGRKGKAGAGKPQDLQIDQELKDRAARIFDILKKEYPNARPLLHFRSAYELLTATVLAAQCTDEMVNKVTADLFPRYPDASSLSAADREELEEIIRPTGFFHNKATSLLKMAGALVEEHRGNVPESLEELVKLPGVGRKTANVVLGHCFGRQAIIVDTHFKRVSGRLGLSHANNPDKIEMEVREIVAEGVWTQFSQVINFHGRYCCQARKPRCPDCRVRDLCPYPEKTPD
jgi:endonuclease-3